MRVLDYRKLIRELPCQNQGFEIYKKNWLVESIEEQINEIFKNSDKSNKDKKITINRFDIENSKNNLPIFILKTLMWGYPTKGRGKNIDKLLARDSLTNLISKLQNYSDREISIDRLKSDIKEIDGLGLSTMTKFTNFLNTTINGNKAVILDLQIISAINRGVFEEFKNLEKINYDNAIKYYPEYLSIIGTISKKINSTPDQIENFLFLFGRSLSEIKTQPTYGK